MKGWCGRAQPVVGDAISGLVVLGGRRKQAEQATGSMSGSSVPPQFLPQPLPRASLEFPPWLPSVTDYDWVVQSKSTFPSHVAVDCASHRNRKANKVGYRRNVSPNSSAEVFVFKVMFPQVMRVQCPQGMLWDVASVLCLLRKEAEQTLGENKAPWVSMNDTQL